MKKPPIQSHSLWGKLKDRLDPQRSLVVFDPQISEHETDPEKRKLYSEKGLQLWRSYAVANEKNGERQAIWTKRYQLSSSDPRAHNRVFAQWENTLLTAINQKGINSAPRVVKVTYVRSPMSTGITPNAKRLTGVSEVQTLDLGPDMDLWSKASAYVAEDQQAQSVLYEPRHLLLFLQATLTALLDHHNENFVHCDLHWGNIALPADAKAFIDPVHGECLSITPRWQNLKLFDWDVGACSNMSNVVPPFIDHWKGLDTKRRDLLQPRTQTSNHLRLRLAYLEAVALAAGAALHAEAFWTECTAKNQNHLACLQKLDWRVDLYAVGYWLAEHLRDPDNLRRYNQPKYQEHMQFLNGFADELCRWDLPDKDCGINQEDLMQGEQTPQEWLEDLKKVLNKAESSTRPAKPHQKYLARIAALLSTAPPAREQWLIRRQDHDAAYKKYWDWKQDAGFKNRWRSIGMAVEQLLSDVKSALRFGGTVHGWAGLRLLIGIPFFVLLLLIGDWFFTRYPPISHAVSAWAWASQKVNAGIQNLSTVVSEIRDTLDNAVGGKSSVQRLLEAFPQHPGVVAKASLHAGSADKPQSQFLIGDRFSFTVTNPTTRDGYLTVFAADAEDEKAQRLRVVLDNFNHPIASMATATCPSKETCHDGFEKGNADILITGPARPVRMLAVITPAPIDWPIEKDQVGMGLHIHLNKLKKADDITALFNCASQSGAAQQACQDARQNFAVSPVVTYEVVGNKPAAQAAQTAPALQPSLLHGRYQIVAGGSEVKDVQTGLTWARCSVGQSWNGSTCAGEAKTFTFDQAQQLAGNGWRVPTVRELHSLVWCSSGKTRDRGDPKDGQGPINNRCGDEYSQPTLRSDVFAQTPANWYWTSSPYVGNSSYAWYVYFFDGSVYYGSRGYSSQVRLVRASQ